MYTLERKGFLTDEIGEEIIIQRKVIRININIIVRTFQNPE